MATRKTTAEVEIVQADGLKEKLVKVAEAIVDNLVQFNGNLNAEQIKQLETAMQILQLTKE